MAIAIVTRRFTVDEYHRMVTAGILQEDDKVELIDGEIVEMSPIGGEHAACVDRALRLFTRLPAERVQVRIQNPITIGQHSEPEPDLVLARPRADYYAGGHPGPADILLLIEVADSSLEFDRRKKVPLYAAAGIPETWLVNLPRKRIEVHRSPSPNGYQDVQAMSRGSSLCALAFPDFMLTVEDILGR